MLLRITERKIGIDIMIDPERQYSPEKKHN